MRPFSAAWFREQRAVVEARWYLWLVVVVFFIYGLGGFVWCVYNRWWVGAAFTTFWLVALVVLFGPSRRGWQRRRAQRRAR